MRRRTAGIALAALLAVACKSESTPPAPLADDAAAPPPRKAPDASPRVSLPPLPAVPKPTTGLPPTPRRHRATRAEVLAVGEALFSSTRVWREGGTLACASCHQPEHGFSSPEPLPRNSDGKTNLRHAPTLFNVVYQDTAYWDGRAAGVGAIESMLVGHARGQLGADLEETAVRLSELPRWRALLGRARIETPTGSTLATALASYVRTRFSPPSAWDRHEAGNSSAAGEAAIRGAGVFNARAGCALCHPPPLYTDLRFHRSAVAEDAGPPDLGRMRVTDDLADRRAFRTPTLRGLLATAPYFHNGAIATLDAALDVELARSSARTAELTPAERADLLAFLRALSP